MLLLVLIGRADELSEYHRLFAVPVEVFVVGDLDAVGELRVEAVGPVEEGDGSVADEGLGPVSLFEQAHLLLDVVVAQIELFSDRV